MTWLILDVDGVLLDAMRGGRGSWKYEFSSRFNVDADELREDFFEPYWDDIIIGKRDFVPALGAALHSLRWDIDVEDALACWFEADFVPNDDVVRKVDELRNVVSPSRLRRTKNIFGRLSSRRGCQHSCP